MSRRTDVSRCRVEQKIITDDERLSLSVESSGWKRREVACSWQAAGQAAGLLARMHVSRVPSACVSQRRQRVYLYISCHRRTFNQATRDPHALN